MSPQFTVRRASSRPSNLADKIVVMSREGDGIREMVPVVLPCPRDRSCREFVEVREALLREFRLSTH
jgi:ABC-type nitrate/sulfonate/bicarbonate transport system ATPase subunit